MYRFIMRWAIHCIKYLVSDKRQIQNGKFAGSQSKAMISVACNLSWWQLLWNRNMVQGKSSYDRLVANELPTTSTPGATCIYSFTNYILSIICFTMGIGLPGNFFLGWGWSLLPEYFLRCLPEKQVVLPKYYLLFALIWKVLRGGGGGGELQPP